MHSAVSFQVKKLIRLIGCLARMTNLYLSIIVNLLYRLFSDLHLSFLGNQEQTPFIKVFLGENFSKNELYNESLFLSIQYAEQVCLYVEVVIILRFKQLKRASLFFSEVRFLNYHLFFG